MSKDDKINNFFKNVNVLSEDPMQHSDKFSGLTLESFVTKRKKKKNKLFEFRHIANKSKLKFLAASFLIFVALFLNFVIFNKSSTSLSLLIDNKLTLFKENTNKTIKAKKSLIVKHISGTKLHLARNTSLTLNYLNGKLRVILDEGSILINFETSKILNKINILAGQLEAKVIGTKFLVIKENKQSALVVFSGRVKAFTSQSKKLVTANIIYQVTQGKNKLFIKENNITKGKLTEVETLIESSNKVFTLKNLKELIRLEKKKKTPTVKKLYKKITVNLYSGEKISGMLISEKKSYFLIQINGVRQVRINKSKIESTKY